MAYVCDGYFDCANGEDEANATAVSMPSLYCSHMSIGKVWIYCLLFVCFCLFVCTVTDFSAEDKASRVIFCTIVHRRPGQGISFWGTLFPEALPKSPISARALVD